VETDKKPQQHTQDAIEALVTGPGAVLFIREIQGEFVLARVEFTKEGGTKAMKWVGIDPSTGGDIHWTQYHKLGSVGNYHFLFDSKGDIVAQVDTLEDAPYTEAGVLQERLRKWRYILTLHSNQLSFNEFFDNE